MPIYAFEKIGVALSSKLVCFIAGGVICSYPLLTTSAKFFSSLDFPDDFKFFWWSGSLYYNIIYIGSFLLVLYIVPRIPLLAKLFLPFLHLFWLKNLFLSVSRNLISRKLPYLSVLSFTLILLAILVVYSPVHFAWITAPRFAYMEGRSGFGLIFILFLLCINLSSFYIGKSYFRDRDEASLLLPFKGYLALILFVLMLSSFTGTKSTPINVALTQLILYISVRPSLTLRSLLGSLLKLRVNFVSIFVLISITSSIIYLIISLSGYSLITYLSEPTYLLAQIAFVSSRGQFEYNFTTQLASLLSNYLPMSLSWILNMDIPSSLEYTNSVLNQNIMNFINFPPFDQSLYMEYLLGDLSYLGSSLSAITECLPYALFLSYILYARKHVLRFTSVLPVCALSLGYLPLLSPVISLNFFVVLSYL